MNRQSAIRSALASLCPAVMGFVLAVPSMASAAEEISLAAKVKAAYLYHLTRFVDWPASVGETLRICVQGDETIGALLGEVANRQVNNRVLKVEPGFSGDPAPCQVLFIGRADRKLGATLDRARGQSILTVSDLEDFTRRGGIVGFYLDGGKIKLEINPENARAANLKVSAKLLEVARTTP